LVLAALSGIAKAWESPFNQSKFSAAPPTGQFSVGVNKPEQHEHIALQRKGDALGHGDGWLEVMRQPEPSPYYHSHAQQPSQQSVAQDETLLTPDVHPLFAGLGRRCFGLA
jgi:hypothetical protein